MGIAIHEAEVIIDVLEAKINKYFKAADHDSIASLYHSDCVIIDRQSKSALFGREGVKSTNLQLSKGGAMQWKTFNKSLDLATSHFVYSGKCELSVQAEEKTYRGTFKQILQRFGSEWLIIYEIFDMN